MDHEPRSNHRLLTLALFLAAVLLVYAGILYDLQVTNHEAYLTRAIHSIAREETVDASRGIITDRSGRVMVSNTASYDLTFDKSLLEEGDDENEAILRLLTLCKKNDKLWVDNLPISDSAPYVYTLDTASDTQRSRFLVYLKSLPSAANMLADYLGTHSYVAQSWATASEEAENTDSAEENAPALSLIDRGKNLLKQMPASALSEILLKSAGLTPEVLLELMAEDMEIQPGFTRPERRRLLGVRYELALRKLGNYTDYILVEDIDTAFISLISDGHFPGARITGASIRQYETPYAAHILGYVSRLDVSDDLKALREKGYDGNDWIGRSGVESAFEQYLKGTDGRRVVSVNSDGKVTGEYYSREPQPGNTVELTIDLELQAAVENALAETVTAMNEADGNTARGAGAVVIQVGTGEVLSLASFPTYDLATFRQGDNWAALSADPSTPMVNRATSGTYAPGSTLKPLTAIAGLEEALISLKEKIYDTGRWYYPGDPTGSSAGCWVGYPGHGGINVTKAITVSCNYFFAELGYRLGMDTFREYLTAFGLGENTGLEIGDKAGLLPENQRGENQTPWAAFGQSNQLYTPVQLANYIATLVSGGKHYEAHLLKTVKTYDNAEVVATGAAEPIRDLEIDPDYVSAVKKGMHDLTTSTLSKYFNSCVVSAGAKTGTAQVFSETANNGVFVCFAPYEDPEIAVAIVIEKGGSGSALASTAVNILNAYFSEDEIGTAILPENQLIP